jgi:hypothetical protein
MIVKRKRVRQTAAKHFTDNPSSMEVLKQPQAVRDRMACWCGAAGGEPCLNANGEPQGAQHKTRGLERKVVVAIAKASGVPWPR